MRSLPPRNLIELQQAHGQTDEASSNHDSWQSLTTDLLLRWAQIWPIQPLLNSDLCTMIAVCRRFNLKTASQIDWCYTITIPTGYVVCLGQLYSMLFRARCVVPAITVRSLGSARQYQVFLPTDTATCRGHRETPRTLRRTC